MSQRVFDVMTKSTSFAWTDRDTICLQSVLYNLELSHIRRSLEYIDNASRNAMAAGLARPIRVAYGDCSPSPAIDAETLEKLRRTYSHIGGIDYTFFDANLGSAASHNRLLAGANSELTVILNPDVLVSPNAFVEMRSALAHPGVGLVEARQIPIEHPKYYDPDTGETSWASTACTMARTALLQQLGGFDSDTFFLYCDDVDLCWRARLAGHKIIYECSACVFHDKRVDRDGGWISSSAEKYYSAEAALLLTYKYSRSDITEQYVNDFRRSGDEALIKAADQFELRRDTGKLPAQLDPDNAIAQFLDGDYTPRRYAAR